MKTIHKFKLNILGYQKINIPQYSKIIHVGIQDNRICMWVIVDTDDSLKGRGIVIVGTGYMIPKNECRLEYLETVQLNSYIWHIFEEV